MSAHNQTDFGPMPPIRTSTNESQKSIESTDQISSTSASNSPTSRAFFGAITKQLRERSRSRCRVETFREHTRSPRVLPPQHLQQSPSQHPDCVSQTISTQTPVKEQRPSLQKNGRTSTSGSDPWRGRHSNDWLFNGFSFRSTARDAFERRKA